MHVRPVALVVGNEGSGVTQEMEEHSDILAYVPMPGFTQVSHHRSRGLWVVTRVSVTTTLEVAYTGHHVPCHH